MATEMKRLPPPEERVVLREMERQLLDRGLCLRQGDKLVFASHCGRDRPTLSEHPAVLMSYRVKSFLDDIHAALVVKLAGSDAFRLGKLWRDAADFSPIVGECRMGIHLRRDSASEGEVDLYFGNGVSDEQKVVFARCGHGHLGEVCEEVQCLRHFVCPHCGAPKGNRNLLTRKLLADPMSDTECDSCGKRFVLHDELERIFASERSRREADAVAERDEQRREARRREKLLALEVAARIASADQESFEIPRSSAEDGEMCSGAGIDLQLKFTDDHGQPTYRGLFLDLRPLATPLQKWESDGAELFAIPHARWVRECLDRPCPVMLVIGYFAATEGHPSGAPWLKRRRVPQRGLSMFAGWRSPPWSAARAPMAPGRCVKLSSQANGWI